MKRFPTEFSKRFRLACRYVPIFMLVLILLLGMAAASRAQTWTTIDYGFNPNALGINNRGDIVGRWDDADGNTHGFLLRDGNFTPIDFPGAVFTSCITINNRGTIVGRYVDSNNISHGYILKKGKFTTIDIPSSTNTRLRGINDSGNLVGGYTDADGNSHGFLLRDGNFTQIDVPGADFSDAWQINDRGEIVGDYIKASDPIGFFHAFKVVQGVIIPIDDFPGATGGTSALGINNKGQIVGAWAFEVPNVPPQDLNVHGYLLTNKGYQDIEFPLAGVTQTEARGINNQGTIVGWYTDADGNDHGFVRTKQGANCLTLSSPTLLDPPNQSIVGKGSTLDWSDVNGALTYDVQIAANRGFTHVVASMVGLTESQWTVNTDLAADKLFYWRARAVNSCGSGPWSAARIINNFE